MQLCSRLVSKFIHIFSILHAIQTSYAWQARWNQKCNVSVDGLGPEDTCELVPVEKKLTALLEEVDVTGDEAD